MAERYAWGIDIGNRALKAIKLVRDAEGLRVDDFEVVEHETVLSSAGDNRESLIQAALASFTQRHPMKGSTVAVGVSGQSSFARFIKLPPVEPKKIPEIVRFEAIQQIPFPLDDVEWSYQLFQAPESPDVEVGIFAMRKELINQHIQYFTDADMNVQVVQMNPLAVYNAMYYDSRIKETTMIIDLGAENTDLIIADADTIWLRSIPIGGNNFTESLVKAFKLNFAKAEDLKRNAATSKYARQIFQAMRPVFADLVAEVQRSIGFYASVHRDSRISKMLAIGATFKLPGLQKYLQQNLQLEVERLDNLGTGTPADPKLAAGFNDNILSLVSAYGLAIQAMGEGKITSSLLPSRIRRERMWQEKTKWFAAAAAVFVLAPVVGYGRYFADNLAFDKQNASRSAIGATVSQATDLDNKWKDISGRGSKDRDGIKNIRSLENYRELWPDILVDIQKALPQVVADVNVLKQTPRNQRQQILIDSIMTQYRPDLNPILADPDFTRFASMTTDFTMPASAMSGAGQGGYGVPSGFGMGGPPEGAGAGAAFPEAGGGAAAGGAVSGEAQRGFLLTISGVTPFNNAASLIESTLVKALTASNATVAPGQKYTFAKVVLIGASQIRSDNLRLQAIKKSYDDAMQSKKQGTITSSGSIFGTSGNVGDGVIGPPEAAGAGNPFPPTAAAGGPATPTEDPRTYFDRVTDEDMRDDWQFKVLIAVVLDPPPKAPAPPATPGASGTEAAPAGTPAPEALPAPAPPVAPAPAAAPAPPPSATGAAPGSPGDQAPP